MSKERARKEVTSPSEGNLSAAMRQYREAWKDNTLTPELVNQTWNAFWQERWIGPLEIPSCDRTAEELAALRDQNRGIVLLPDAVMSNKGGQNFLARLFPEWGQVINKMSFTNNSEEGGCVDVEMDVEMDKVAMESLIKNIDLELIKLRLTDQGKAGQRIPTYVIASHFSRLAEGAFFDAHRNTQKALHSLLTGSDATAGMVYEGTYNPDLRRPVFKKVKSAGTWNSIRSEGRKK